MEQQNKDHQPLDQNQAEFMIGALVGAMAGAAAALLLTPKNGKQMRALVKEYAKEWESEAYELAKESKGVTKSLRQALDEGVANIAEVAPQKIEDAAQQAHGLANTIEQHIEAARDTVSEITEAFRSGWAEYGEELLPADQLASQDAPVKLDLPDVLMPVDHSDDQPTLAAARQSTEDSDLQDDVLAPIAHTRRRSQPAHFSMHSVSDEPESPPAKSSTAKARPMLASEEVLDQPQTQADTPRYTTRVLEEATPARPAKAEAAEKPAKEAKAKAKDPKEDKEAKEDKKHKSPKSTKAKATDEAKDSPAEPATESSKPSKKLFFRRGS